MQHPIRTHVARAAGVPARARALLASGSLPLATLVALSCGGQASSQSPVSDYDRGAPVAAPSEPAPVAAPVLQDDATGRERRQDDQGKNTGDGPELPPGVGQDDGARLDYAVGTQNHNFGNLMQGAVASHTFDLTAKGTEELVIKNVKPTCGCTVAQVMVQADDGSMVAYTMGEPIQVGRKIQVPAELHTKNKHGHQNTRINIFSNDPRGTIQLGLEADIQPFFNVNPRFLNFGQLRLGEVQSQQAIVTTSEGNPVLLTLMDPSIPSGAKTELVALNPDENGKSSRWQLTVTLGPDLVEGNLARALVLQSDVEIPGEGGHDHPGHGEPGHVHAADEHYQASITLSAQVVGPFTYTPNYLSMGLVRPGQVVTRTIRVESHDEDYRFSEKQPNVRLAGLPVPGGEGYQEWDMAQYFAHVVRPVENQNAIDIELRLEGLPESASGSFRGTLIVELGHADKPEIALTITGVCRGGPVPPRPDLPKTGGAGGE